MNEQQIAAIVAQIVSNANSNEQINSSHKCSCKSRKMTLDKAKQLAKIVEQRATQMGVKAVIAVADAGGNPILVQSMDDAYLASWEVALQKSYTVVALKMSTAQLSQLAQPGQPLYGVQFVNNGRIVIFGGGEPLQIDGKVVGGLGVSGGTAEQDTALAEYGKQKFEEILRC